jgi:branched-chain amino acid transport system permease protein
MNKKLLFYLGIRIGVLFLLLVLPGFLSSYWASIWTEVLIFGIFAMSLDLILGYTGLPTLGHASCFGIAAYTTAILGVKFGWNQLPLSMLAGILMAALLYAVIGLLVLRTRGIVFLMVTLALAQCIWAIVWKWTSLTGGSDGLPGVARPDLGLSWWRLSNAHHFYYFVLLFFIMAFLLQYLIMKSPFGEQSLVGIRENESRMRSLGYNVWLHLYIVFIFSGIFGGIAGCLMVWYNNFASTSLLDISQSANVMLMVILGGAGTPLGPLLGAAIIVLMKNVVAAFTVHWLLVMGIVYVLTVMYMPRGIVNALREKLQMRKD